MRIAFLMAIAVGLAVPAGAQTTGGLPRSLRGAD
jgi:hypothetical protein